MKHISTLALVLAFGGASIHAEQQQVRMTFSGDNVHGPVVVQPGQGTEEETVAGQSSLGEFTYHDVLVQSITPVPSAACQGLNFQIMTGAGVFRFEDGSLMTTNLTQGSICVNLAIPQATVTQICQVTGGTGRFNNASGTLKFTAIWGKPLLFDSTMTPVFFPVSGGEVTGTIVLPDRKD